MTEPRTLHDLKNSPWAEPPLRGRTVRDEIRSNLLLRLASGESLFPGIVGYEDTILPQIVNALLARHHFILLGLRGQAKSRLLRELTGLLDERIPIVAGSEVNDDPFAAICSRLSSPCTSGCYPVPTAESLPSTSCRI